MKMVARKDSTQSQLVLNLTNAPQYVVMGKPKLTEDQFFSVHPQCALCLRGGSPK